jgi:RES domain-containing protein
LADSTTSAILEVLVRLNIVQADVPTEYQLMTVEVPDEIAFRTIVSDDLPADWREDQTLTQRLGDQWLITNETALMRVPSALAPHTWNWLLNPAHRDAQHCVIVSTSRELFDQRLFR